MIPRARSSSGRRLPAGHDGPAEDGVERRAELVRHRGQEVVLRAVRDLRLGPRGALALEEARALSGGPLGGLAGEHLVGHVDREPEDHFDLPVGPRIGCSEKSKKRRSRLPSARQSLKTGYSLAAIGCPVTRARSNIARISGRRAEGRGRHSQHVAAPVELPVRDVRELALEVGAAHDRDDGRCRHEHRVEAIDAESLRDGPGRALGEGAQEPLLDVGEVVRSASTRSGSRRSPRRRASRGRRTDCAQPPGRRRRRSRGKARRSRRSRPRDRRRSGRYVPPSRWFVRPRRARATPPLRAGESSPSRRCRPLRGRRRGASGAAPSARPPRGPRWRSARTRRAGGWPRRARACALRPRAARSSSRWRKRSAKAFTRARRISGS